MAIKTENLYRKLYDNLRSKGYETTPINATTGKDTVPEDADFLQFDFDKEEDVSPVTLVVEKFNDRYALIAYYNDDSAYTDSEEWSNLIPKIRSIAQRCGIHGFVLKNSNDFKPDMAKRQYMKKQEQITEGYHAMGKQSSYNDAIPNVKIILQHNKKIEEGEQRFRHIAKIFVENANGERFLIPTNKPGLARVYARHIAEGGTPYDDRANHISSLVEEYEKMGGFVRAIRNKQFNESTQKLVLEGVGHYQKLRETLSRMTGHRGYNVYFESWTPPLMEDDADATSITELFVQETVDPRIESAMPILAKLSKNISEMAEISELAEWADSLLEGGDGGEASEEPVEQIEEAPGAETLSHNQSTEKQNLKAFGLAEDDLQEPAIDELDEEESLTSNNPTGIPEGRLDGEADIDSPVADAITRRILFRHTDLLAKYGPEKVSDAIATVADSLDGFIGPDDEIGTSDVSGWVKRVEQELGGSQLEESHMSEADMIIQDVINGELDAYDVMNHPKTPEEEYVANILQQQYEEVSRDHRLHPDDDFEQILDIVVDNLAKDYGHPEDPNQVEESERPGLWANIHAKRERIKAGSGEKMRKPGSKGAPSAQDFKDAAKEGIGDVAKKVGSALKTGAKAVGKAIVGPDDDELLRDLKKKAGVRNPQTGKPSMAHSDVEKVDEVDLGQYDAVKTPLKGKDTSDWDKNFREKLALYTKELDQRQKEKKEKSEKVDEDGQFAGDYKTGPEGQWRNKGPKANKPAKVGDLVGASESAEPKKEMLEGQEDLNAILRIIKK